jgi:hypothetical protein
VLRVRLGENRGRLVEHEDRTGADQRFRDLGETKMGDAERARARLGIKTGAHFEKRGLDRLPVEATEAASSRSESLGSKQDVASDRKLRDHQNVLRNDRDAEPLGFRRAGDRNRRAADQERTLVGRMHAAQDLDQRRFAGPVLAEEGVSPPPSGDRGRRRPKPSRPESVW